MFRRKTGNTDHPPSHTSWMVYSHSFLINRDLLDLLLGSRI